MSRRLSSAGIVLQPRDYDFLACLLDSRLMTLKQIAALQFEGRIEAAKKRLQKLQFAGLLLQRERRPQESGIYHLSREGYRILKAARTSEIEKDVGWAAIYRRQRISEFMLGHELAVVDLKVAISAGLKQRPEFDLVEMSTLPDRYKFRAIDALPESGGVRFRSLVVKPDGFLHVREKRENEEPMDHYIFIEVDRGTESIGRILRKLRLYRQFYRKGGFALRRGATREEFNRFPFRVLTSFHSARRRDNVVQQLMLARSLKMNQVWLATMTELLEKPLEFLFAERWRTRD